MLSRRKQSERVRDSSLLSLGSGFESAWWETAKFVGYDSSRFGVNATRRLNSGFVGALLAFRVKLQGASAACGQLDTMSEASWPGARRATGNDRGWTHRRSEALPVIVRIETITRRVDGRQAARKGRQHDEPKTFFTEVGSS